MINVNEKLMNLKASVFDNSENVKAYSVRLPLTLSANVDGIANYSGKSRNLILIDLVNLGLAYFIENLSEPEKYELGKAIDQSEESYLLNIWRVKNNVTDDWNGGEPIYQEGGKDKEGKERAEPTHKVQILGAVDLPNGDVQNELVDLKVENLADWQGFRNKVLLLILVSMPAKKTLLFILLRRVQSLVCKMW